MIKKIKEFLFGKPYVCHDIVITDIQSAIDAIPDLKIVGNGDTFQLLCKVINCEHGWMKSTKAMLIPHSGVVINVTTQQGKNVTEALTFIAGDFEIIDDINNGKKINNRSVNP